MPQMGESIAEGTIVRWIKKVGDPIDRDEPLFEISTDKVDAEIPSPGAGVLLEIRVKEGETVPVNSVVAVIGGESEERESGGALHVAPPPNLVTPEPRNLGTPEPQNPRTSEPQNPRTSEPQNPRTPEPRNFGASDVTTLRRQRSSPVVRKIAKEHGVDLSRLNGTGISGRVTRRDILAYVEKGREQAPAAARAGRPMPAFTPGEDVRIEKMSVMRKKIAEHMVLSAHTSPHVYSVYEVDFHRVEQLRQAKKAAYEQAGTRLTYTAFVAKATLETIRDFPFANASIDGDNIVYKRDVNLGIAVALDAGLIVPVIKDAGARDMTALCRAIQDLAHRARSKQLKPEEVQGGTFTITNPGVFGALFGLPLINQPQVAILGVGAIEKRVAVIDDMIAVRPMCYLSLGYDHRLIDGADGGRFLHALKQRLEQFDESWM
jgi:2-oxoglutarate dehydrogenase E2 component (dihydrolipoamide succinyltransferase)